MIWECGKFKFDTVTPTIMGVLNVTPDSFSDGGDHFDVDAAVAAANRMAKDGALIIDVGGESTRPGASPVSPDEEWGRIGAVVEALAKQGLCVSVDTRHYQVAEKAIAAGASVVNDVSGFRDPLMVKAVRDANVGLVVMHMQGEPATMQDDPRYDDVVAEVCGYPAARGGHIPQAHLPRSRPRLRQDPQADHRADAQHPRGAAVGLPGDGGGFAQALRRLRLPY